MFDFKQISETGEKVVSFITMAQGVMASLEESNIALHSKVDELTAKVARLEAAHETLMGFIAESEDDSLADSIGEIREAAALVSNSAAHVETAAESIETAAEEVTAEATEESEPTTVEETTIVETPTPAPAETTTAEVPALPVSEPTPVAIVPDATPDALPPVKKRRWI